jgi:hypothetical protein
MAALAVVEVLVEIVVEFEEVAVTALLEVSVLLLADVVDDWEPDPEPPQAVRPNVTASTAVEEMIRFRGNRIGCLLAGSRPGAEATRRCG